MAAAPRGRERHPPGRAGAGAARPRAHPPPAPGRDDAPRRRRRCADDGQLGSQPGPGGGRMAASSEGLHPVATRAAAAVPGCRRRAAAWEGPWRGLRLPGRSAGRWLPNIFVFVFGSPQVETNMQTTARAMRVSSVPGRSRRGAPVLQPRAHGFNGRFGALVSTDALLRCQLCAGREASRVHLAGTALGLGRWHRRTEIVNMPVAERTFKVTTDHGSPLLPGPCSGCTQSRRPVAPRPRGRAAGDQLAAAAAATVACWKTTATFKSEADAQQKYTLARRAHLFMLSFCLLSDWVCRDGGEPRRLLQRDGPRPAEIIDLFFCATPRLTLFTTSRKPSACNGSWSPRPY